MKIRNHKRSAPQFPKEKRAPKATSKRLVLPGFFALCIVLKTNKSIRNPDKTVICQLTRGKDEDTLQEFIKEIC